MEKRKMTQYIIFSCCAGDRSDGLSVKRFVSAKEAIFYFISDCCARYDGCMNKILEKLTVYNEDEITKQIKERADILEKGFKIKNDDERDEYLDKHEWWTDDVTPEYDAYEPDENEEYGFFRHTSYAYEFWLKRNELIKTLEKTDLCFDMEKMFPCLGFNLTYITSGYRETENDVNICAGRPQLTCYEECDVKEYP